MENKSTLIAIVVSALFSSACTATALWLSGNLNQHGPEETGSIEARLIELENQLGIERQARQEFERQVNSPPVNLDTPRSLQENLPPELESASVEQVPEDQANLQYNSDQIQQFRQQSRQQRRAEFAARQQPQYRIQQLVSAGFAQEEATRIVQIESEEQLRQLQARYDSRRKQAEQNGSNSATSNALRAELGDQNYERYLEANGWPTSPQIGAVIGGSPGAIAGLQNGDRIVSYAGTRTFNFSDVNNLTVQGTVGESVLIEVERNGEPIQLTIPRGPIGVSGRGRW